jgi:hypothetical protein
MALETATQYLQAIALGVFAIYNALLAYEAWPKIWKVALSGLTSLILAVMAWHRLWPIF